MFFAREGFTRSHADHSLYIMQSKSYILIVIIYIDDLIMMTNDMGMMKELKV